MTSVRTAPAAVSTEQRCYRSPVDLRPRRNATGQNVQRLQSKRHWAAARPKSPVTQVREAL